MKSDINGIVKEYLTYYPEEKEKLSKLTNLLNNNKDNYNNLFNRKNYEGHITASGYIFAKNDNKMLLLEHKALKKFLQPGGHAELSDETILDTAKREIKEETGLENLELVNISVNEEIPFDINTHFIPKNDKKNEDDHYHNDFRYLFVVDNADDIKIDESESNSYKWIDISDIKDNSNFAEIIRKIFKLFNSKYTIKQYYSKIIKEFDINLKDYKSIVISHFLPDCIEYLDTMNCICPILKLIPKPNSIDQDVYNVLDQKYDILKTNRNEIVKNKELINAIKESPTKIIIFDIGAYFADFIQENKNIASKIELIIEDTENGHQKYEKIKTDIPVISVARSPLKENEDYLVGESVIFSADFLLRNVGEILEHMQCGIIGYGKIGESIATHLLQKGIKPCLYDFNEIKQIRAYNRGCNISTKKDILKNSDVIFLATGNHSMNIDDFKQLKNGTYIFSVTSSDDELDDSFLEKEYEIEEILPHIFKYSNHNNYFYLIQKGNAVNFINNAVMGDFIYLTKSEMIVDANLYVKTEKENFVLDSSKLLETNEETRKKISKIWLETFKKNAID